MTALYAADFVVAPGHPALDGHFPGDPIVPGVVLLSFVLRAARACLGNDIVLVQLPRVKFAAPLRPGEHFTIRIERGAHGEAKFSALRDATCIALGRLRYAQNTSVTPKPS